MYRKIATLGKHAAIYGTGSVGTRILGFLLIPVYTRFMSPADYGVLALCTTTVGVLKLLSLAGIPSALFRSYLLTERSAAEKDKILGTALTTLLLLGLLIFAGLVAFRKDLAVLIFGSEDHTRFILLIAALNFCYIIHAVRNANFRLKDESTRFAAFTFLTFFITLALSLYLVVARGQGAWGAMSANLTGMAIMAVLFLPWSLGRISKGFSRSVFRDLVGYGLPLVPGGVAVWVMNLSDIYMLRFFRPETEVGLYNLGYRFGLGIYILSNALKTAFPKVLFSEVRDPAAGRMFARIPTYYVVTMGFFCLAVSVFSPEIILIADERFHLSQAIIPFAVFAYFFNGLVPLVEIGLDIQRKPYLLALVFMIGAAINILLNLLFIPRYGMYAAALTTLATYVLLLMVTYSISRLLYPLHLEWVRLGKTVAALSAIGLLAYVTPFETRLGNVIYKAILMAAYLPLLLALRVFNAEELGRARRFLSLWRTT